MSVSAFCLFASQLASFMLLSVAQFIGRHHSSFQRSLCRHVFGRACDDPSTPTSPSRLSSYLIGEPSDTTQTRAQDIQASRVFSDVVHVSAKPPRLAVSIKYSNLSPPPKVTKNQLIRPKPHPTSSYTKQTSWSPPKKFGASL